MRSIEIVKRERQRVLEEMRAMKGICAFDSNANFILFDAGKSFERVHAGMIQRGVSIRKVGKIGKWEGLLRATIGTEEMNDRLLSALKGSLQSA